MGRAGHEESEREGVAEWRQAKVEAARQQNRVLKGSRASLSVDQPLRGHSVS